MIPGSPGTKSGSQTAVDLTEEAGQDSRPRTGGSLSAQPVTDCRRGTGPKLRVTVTRRVGAIPCSCGACESVSRLGGDG